VIGSQPMPLLSRLAALYGDADQAAKLLGEAARGLNFDIERLRAAPMFTEPAPVADRRGLRFGLGRSGSPRFTGVVAAPAPTA
jgi:hypothetical protein